MIQSPHNDQFAEFQFGVVSSTWNAPRSAVLLGVLSKDNWDDFGFKTTFLLMVIDEKGDRHEIGAVKIAKFGSKEGHTQLPSSPFKELGQEYFSLGQGEEYYQNLRKLTGELRLKILKKLQDVAFSEELWVRAQDEEVTQSSLLRFVPFNSVSGQLRRIARGGRINVAYDFYYELPKRISLNDRLRLQFTVDPESSPPTNLHVLIGRNGVGKSYLFGLMIKALVGTAKAAAQSGRFQSILESNVDLGFTRLVSISFSAFDQFEPIELGESNLDHVSVRIQQMSSTSPRSTTTKTPTLLAKEFAEALEIITQESLMKRWKSALETLESDPVFADAGISSQLFSQPNEFLEDSPIDFYRKKLSSGHKIVLLMLARLVENVREKTLVFIDEPESHLHPPLLSAFVRALSNLMRETNGVCLVATHSPVVLQEVPKLCVWQMNRNGDFLTFERPERETFGENVGSLTRDVFGFEVTESGFHKLLAEARSKYSTYEEALESLGGQLGGEARGILRAMFSSKN